VAIQIDTGAPLRGVDDLRRLVEAVFAADDHDEADWIEWKSTLDMSTKDGAFAVARVVLGLANRLPDRASITCGGLGYVVVGAEPGRVSGVVSTDPASLDQLIEPYLGAMEGPRWSPVYLPVMNATVLVVTVEAPRAGDRIFPLRREFAGARGGTVFVRKNGRTIPADSGDLDALQDRLIAAGSAAEIAGIDIGRRRLQDLIGTLIEMRTEIVSHLRDHSVTPRSGTPESLHFVEGCSKVLNQLDAMGDLALDLVLVRRFAQSQGFNTIDIDRATFEAQGVLRRLGRSG